MKLLAIIIVLFAALMSFDAVSALMCYRCLAMNTSEEIGGDVKLHKSIRDEVITILEGYYVFEDERDVQACPSPTAQETWEELQTQSAAWNRPCKADFRNDLSCALGRFRVTATDHEGKVTILHGTITGCGKRKLKNEALLQVSSETVEKAGDGQIVVKETTTTLRTCQVSVHPREEAVKGITYSIELEHCASNLCYNNFCVQPQETQVRVFIDPQELYIPWLWIILGVSVIGFFIGLFAMLGLKYS